MKIGELLDTLSQTGNTVASVAKGKVGIGEKKLKEALHAAGYEYSNQKPKGWNYVGEGEAPLHKEILDYVTKSNKPVIKGAQQSNKRVGKVSQPSETVSNASMSESNKSGELYFTSAEITALKDMAQEYLTGQSDQTDRDRLHLRIMKLEKESRKRKTVVMSESVAERFDDFADKMKFNKSDLLELAVMDFLAASKEED
jgi:hypothetical protein